MTRWSSNKVVLVHCRWICACGSIKYGDQIQSSRVVRLMDTQKCWLHNSQELLNRFLYQRTFTHMIRINDLDCRYYSGFSKQYKTFPRGGQCETDDWRRGEWTIIFNLGVKNLSKLTNVDSFLESSWRIQFC